jgi:hypothetical protein
MSVTQAFHQPVHAVEDVMDLWRHAPEIACCLGVEHIEDVVGVEHEISEPVEDLLADRKALEANFEVSAVSSCAIDCAHHHE